MIGVDIYLLGLHSKALDGSQRSEILRNLHFQGKSLKVDVTISLQIASVTCSASIAWDLGSRTHLGRYELACAYDAKGGKYLKDRRLPATHLVKVD
jgi:hypothetical protein